MQFDPVYITAWLAAGAFFISRWRRLMRHLDMEFGFSSIAGLGLLVVHIVVSYHWAHGWSHEQAAEHVAEQTEKFVGVRTSLGLYANFAVVLVWGLQIACVRGLKTSCRFRTCRNVMLLTEIFLWFMFLNAAIVFAAWPARIVFAGLACLVGYDNWLNRTISTNQS